MSPVIYYFPWGTIKRPENTVPMAGGNIMDKRDKDQVLAVVAGEEITNGDLDAFLETAPNEHSAYIANPKYRDAYLEQLINLRAFAKFGEELNLEETDEFKKIMESARKDILAQMAMTEVIKDVTVTEDDIQKYYEDNAEEYTEPETVRARHILVSDENQCNSILEKIMSGEKSFEECAKEYSTCASSAAYGDLGTFGKGEVVKEFEDVAFSAEVGVLYGPVKTDFGYHIIRVEEKRAAYLLPLVDVKEEIEGKVKKNKQASVYNEKLEELREKYLEK